MKKILKAITFLSLAMCLMLNTSAVYAGGKDDVIFHGNDKKTVYASHESLEELVEAEKREDEGDSLRLKQMGFVCGLIPHPLTRAIGAISGGFVLFKETIKHYYGDTTFLSSCRDKSTNNGKSGCIMKYTLIQHDETPDEWYPDSCEVQ